MDGRVTRRCLKLLFGGSMMSSEIAIVTYDTSDVPSEVLVRLLVGTQQLVLLLGAAQENRTLDRRFRPTEEIRARYQFRVGLTRPGSYIVPVSVVNCDGLLNSPWEDPTPKVGELIDSANRRDWAAFGRILPDPGYSHRAMSVLNEMAPRAGEAWSAQWRAGTLTIACYSAAISSEPGNATGCHRGGIAGRWTKPVAATQFVASRRKPICCGGGDLGNCISA